MSLLRLRRRIRRGRSDRQLSQNVELFPFQIVQTGDAHRIVCRLVLHEFLLQSVNGFLSSWIAALRTFKASVCLQMSASSSVNLRSSRALNAIFFPNLTLFGSVLAVFVTSQLCCQGLEDLLGFQRVCQHDQGFKFCHVCSLLLLSIRLVRLWVRRLGVAEHNFQKGVSWSICSVPWKTEAVSLSAAACPPTCPPPFLRISIHPLHRLKAETGFATNAVRFPRTFPLIGPPIGPTRLVRHDGSLHQSRGED